MADDADPNPLLRPEMREFLAIEGRDRLFACWDRIWIPTDSTRDAFKKMEGCMKAAPSTKPRGLIITGEADTGKSRTMRAFRDAHPSKVNPESEYATFPVLLVAELDSPNRAALYRLLLKTLGHPLVYKTNEDELRTHTLNMLSGCRVGTIIIDELYDVEREYSGQKTVEFLRFLKGMINATGRPMVVGGTPVVIDLVKSEPSLASRLDTVIRLAPFTITEFVKVLLSFERMLPLRRATNFRSDEAAIQLLYTLSSGYMGRLSNKLHDACQVAIESGEERITGEIVAQLKDSSIDAIGRRT